MRGLLAPLIKLIVFLVVTLMFTYVLAATISNQSFGVVGVLQGVLHRRRPA